MRITVKGDPVRVRDVHIVSQAGGSIRQFLLRRLRHFNTVRENTVQRLQKKREVDTWFDKYLVI